VNLRIVNNKSLYRIALFVVFMSASVSHAKDFCFLKAETYYEQTYCEVSAKGYGKHLPDFQDFKKNDALIQALLLKKPAARSGITLAIPRRTARKSSSSAIRPKASKPAKVERAAVKSTAVKSDLVSWRHGCQFDGELLNCTTQQYKLVGNKNNSALADGVLTEANRMGLASYQQDLADSAAVNDYLVSSYFHYIQKMLDIGLGGVTMSSGKFAFLFRDLTDRGLSFSQRFETMYRYLRKDKSTIRVDEKVSLGRAPNIDSCINLHYEIISCASARRNLLFIKVI